VFILLVQEGEITDFDGKYWAKLSKKAHKTFFHVNP